MGLIFNIKYCCVKVPFVYDKKTFSTKRCDLKTQYLHHNTVPIFAIAWCRNSQVLGSTNFAEVHPRCTNAHKCLRPTLER